MKHIPNLVDYIKNSYGKIIEAVVTNNVGYSPDRGRPYTSGGGGIFVYIDCRKIPHGEAIKVDPIRTDLPETTIDDGNWKNLQWHLENLERAKILPWFNERDRRLPLYTEFEYHLFISRGC